MRKKIKKITAVLLAVVIMSAMLSVGALSASASTGGRSQSDAVNWANSKINQSLDYDGAYGAQCVDLIMFYYQYLGNSSPGGDARDYTWNALPSGWNRITNYSGFVPQPGDICVWGGYCGPATTEWGHVGIVISGNASNFNSVEQNVSGQYVQAISNRTTSSVTCFIRPDFNGAVDIGSNFYASISHIVSGKYVTSQTNGNVNLCSDTNIANQYWKFFRQNDGSYKIKSAFSGKCLEVVGASSQNGANIQVNDDNTSSGQSWYIYPCGNGYQLKAKCTTCVMEMNAWSFYEGVNLVSGSKDGSGAEIFAINLKDFNDIGKTNLNVSCKDGKAIFTWGNARCSTAYNIQIWRGNTTSGAPTYSLWNVKNNSFTYSLEEGTYTAYIECFNAFSDYVNSSPVTFKIINYSSLSPKATLKYNNHEYELFNITTTWKQAKEICESRGGYLASINSAEENEKLTNLASSLSNYVWIGGSDEGSEGNWYWVNGDSFTYSNWYSGEPSNSDNKEHYLSLYGKTGMWNDAANDNQYISGFICEYEPEIKTIIGDVNGDEMVDVLDAATVQKYTVNRANLSEEQLSFADVNNDNHVDVLDAAEIQKFAAGIISEFKKKV